MSHGAERVGQWIKGKYLLERLLGEGGMGSVYLASHRNGNRVAVKMLHPALSMDERLRERFLREGYVANKVRHRGAVLVLDDDVADDGAVFLVMELLEGETLEARWQRSGERLPAKEVMAFMHQLLATLAAAHDKGIVHRDLKPENLFLTFEGVLKVLDFGIARLREAKESTATMTGMLMGTPAFMSPEQALGRTKLVDATSDLWSVGATMFTLLTGQLVHQGETPGELIAAVATQLARPIRSVSSEVPEPVAAIIDRALALDKEKRWPNAGAMKAAVELAYRELWGDYADPTMSRPSIDDVAFGETMVSGPGVAAIIPSSGKLRASRELVDGRALVPVPQPSVPMGPAAVRMKLSVDDEPSLQAPWVGGPEADRVAGAKRTTTGGVASSRLHVTAAATRRPAKSTWLVYVAAVLGGLVIVTGGFVAGMSTRPAPLSPAAATSPVAPNTRARDRDAPPATATVTATREPVDTPRVPDGRGRPFESEEPEPVPPPLVDAGRVAPAVSVTAAKKPPPSAATASATATATAPRHWTPPSVPSKSVYDP